MLDENWRPFVTDPFEWAIRDGGLFRRPWLLDETKQVVKQSADYLLRIGYKYVSGPSRTHDADAMHHGSS